MEENIKFNVWHVVFTLMGIICGMMIMCLWFYYFEIGILNHIRIENLEIGFNESKLVEMVFDRVNQSN